MGYTITTTTTQKQETFYDQNYIIIIHIFRLWKHPHCNGKKNENEINCNECNVRTRKMNHLPSDELHYVHYVFVATSTRNDNIGYVVKI